MKTKVILHFDNSTNALNYLTTHPFVIPKGCVEINIEGESGIDCSKSAPIFLQEGNPVEGDKPLTFKIKET